MAATKSPKQEFLDDLYAHIKGHLGLLECYALAYENQGAYQIIGHTHDGISVSCPVTYYEIASAKHPALLTHAICDKMKALLLSHTANQAAQGALPGTYGAVEKSTESFWTAAFSTNTTGWMGGALQPPPAQQSLQSKAPWEYLSEGPQRPTPKTMYELYGVAPDADKV